MAGTISRLNINGSEFDIHDPDASGIAALVNGTYNGVNLATKFANEITGNIWTWIKGRISDGDFQGLNVGDYIPFTADSHDFQAQIAGINTYKGCGNPEIGDHIDFITREIWHENHVMNSTATNNGTVDQKYPWLASGLHSWLENTVFPLLPSGLRGVITEKYIHATQRYDAGGAQDTDTGTGWVQAGKLWIPTEFEVYGAHLFQTSQQILVGNNVQYPLFKFGYSNIAKGAPYWLNTPATGSSSTWARVYGNGTLNTNTATGTTIGVPICFRITA